MNDYMIHAMAANDEIRAYAITAHDTVEYARNAHETAPVVTAALGRMLMGTAMMGMMMQDDRDLITLQVRGDGPMQGITVTADHLGHVKGFPMVSDVEVPPKYPGKLDVGAALGQGFLRVMRDTGAPEPYVGTVDLMTGEIAEDLTYYFAQSEQTPSAVGLGVLVDTDLTIRAAGGFLVQLMPGADEEMIGKLEDNIFLMDQLTTILDEDGTDAIFAQVLKGFEYHLVGEAPVGYRCYCSRERVEEALSCIEERELQEMIGTGETVEVSCQFCDARYAFTPDDLRALLPKESEKK